MMVWAFLALIPCQMVESKAFGPKLQKSAIGATVLVKNATTGRQGSGAIIAQSGPFVYVLTADHVVAKADRVDVSTFTAEAKPKPGRVYRSGEVVAEARDKDLALIRVATRDAVAGRLRIGKPGSAPKARSFPALTVGCNGGGSPSCVVEKVADTQRVRKKGEEGTASYWRVKNRPAGGRSGGPLIDRSGCLLGVCSGADGGNGYYCHLDEIHRFLRLNGFRWIYEQDEDK